jgi:hypothetical protein
MSRSYSSSPNYSHVNERLNTLWKAVLGHNRNTHKQRFTRNQLRAMPAEFPERTRRGSFFENAGYNPRRNIERGGHGPDFVPIPQKTLNATLNRYTRKYKMEKNKLSAFAAPFVPRSMRKTVKRSRSESVTRRPQIKL